MVYERLELLMRINDALATPLLARTPSRLALLLGWMWLGWHFFAR